MKTALLWFLNLILIIVSGIIGLWVGASWFSWWYFLGSLIIFIPVTFLFIWSWLAPNNYFFTFVKEGTAKIVVRGDEFDKALIQWKGYTFDEEWNVVEGKEPWHLFGGLRYYGFWPIQDIYGYNFQWTGVTESDEVVRHPKEKLDYILLKDDIYLTEVRGAEDKELLPLNVSLVLTIRVINPYKTLFRVQNWLETVNSRIRTWVRDTISHDSYEKWISEKKRIGEELFKSLKKQGLLEEFNNRYGIDVRKIEVKDIDPSTEEDYRKFREATLKKYLAQRESERIEVIYEAINKFGDLGKLIRMLETLEASPGAGSKWVIPLPGGADFFRSIFARAPESLTQEDIKEILKKSEDISREKSD